MVNDYSFKKKHTIHIHWKGVGKYTEENSEDIPEKAGVYEILVKRNDGKYNRKYVGRSKNLHERFLEHLSGDEENDDISDGVRKYNCGFDYALLTSEDDRKDAEKLLYKKHKYPWNKEEPEGSERDADIEIVEHSN